MLGANKPRRNQPSCIFISCFNVSVIQSINTFQLSNDFTILIISLISSFEKNKVNPLPALTTPFRLIFLSNLFTAFVAKLLINSSKLALAKGIARSVNAFVPTLPNQEPKD